MQNERADSGEEVIEEEVITDEPLEVTTFLALGVFSLLDRYILYPTFGQPQPT